MEQIFGIHGPNRDNPEFNQSIENKMINNDQDYVLCIAGYSNMTLNPPIFLTLKTKY